MFSKRKPKYENGKKIQLNNVRRQADMKRYVTEPTMYKFILPTNPKLLSSTNAEFDSNNNKILKGTFTVEKEEEIIVSSHHELVTPEYLVEIEVKKDLRDSVLDLLYSKFKIFHFISSTDTRSLCKNSISSNKSSKFK